MQAMRCNSGKVFWHIVITQHTGKGNKKVQTGDSEPNHHQWSTESATERPRRKQFRWKTLSINPQIRQSEMPRSRLRYNKCWIWWEASKLDKELTVITVQILTRVDLLLAVYSSVSWATITHVWVVSLDTLSSVHTRITGTLTDVYVTMGSCTSSRA